MLSNTYWIPYIMDDGLNVLDLWLTSMLTGGHRLNSLHFFGRQHEIIVLQDASRLRRRWACGWCPGSPDLNSLYFWVDKSFFYKTSVDSVKDLVAEIFVVTYKINTTPAFYERLYQSFIWWSYETIDFDSTLCIFFESLNDLNGIVKLMISLILRLHCWNLTHTFNFIRRKT